MRNKNTLLGDFEKVARAMAGRYDLNVVASSSCATDGRTIYFPANADDFDKATTEQLCGWLDHEVGHNKEEDRHALAGKETPIAILNRLASSKERMFFNVFDDLRMEKREMQEHVGVAENIRTCNDYCKKKMMRQIKEGSHPDFWRSIGTAILDKATGGTAPWLAPAEKPFIDALEEEIAEATDLSKTKWGEDVERLVKRALKKLGDVADELKAEKEKREEEKREEEKREETEEGDENGSSDEEGDENGAQEMCEDGDGDAADSEETDDGEELQEGSDEDGSEGNEPNMDDPDSEESVDANAESADGGDAGEDIDEDASQDDNATSESDVGAEPNAGNDIDDGGEFSDMSDEELDDAMDLGYEMEEDAESDDLMDELKDDLNKKADETLVTTGKYAASTTALKRDRWFTPNKDAACYKVAKKEVAPQIKGMKSKLINLIRAQAEDTMVGDRDSGDLDDDVLHTVKTGNRRVYTQLVNGTPLDTAVSILIDQSGSMDGSRIISARQMAVALGETFNALGVPFEIIGFENQYCRRIPRREEENYNLRKSYFNFRIFKEFNESYRRVKERLGSCRAHGDNADGEAVLEVAKRLVVRPESRKLLFVLSDGQPACSGIYRGTLINHLHEVIEKVTAAGIEIIGIGCQYAGVEAYYNEEHGASNVVIWDVSKLAVEVYKVMKAQLLNKGKKRARKGAAA